MAEIKYIVMRSNGTEFPIIFPGYLVHDEVAASILPCIPGYLDKSAKVEIVSAGFIEGMLVITDKERTSETLREHGVPCRGKVDQDLIDLYRFMGGYVGDQD